MVGKLVRPQPDWAKDDTARKQTLEVAVQIISANIPKLSGSTQTYNILRHLANVTDLADLGRGVAFPTRQAFLDAVQKYAVGQRAADWDNQDVVQRALETMSAVAKINGSEATYAIRYWLVLKHLPAWTNLDRYVLSSSPSDLFISDVQKFGAMELRLREVMSFAKTTRETTLSLGAPIERAHLLGLEFTAVVDWATQWKTALLEKNPQLKVKAAPTPQGRSIFMSPDELLRKRADDAALAAVLKSTDEDLPTAEISNEADTSPEVNEQPQSHNEIARNPFFRAKRQPLLRLALAGATGSGKTYTALRLGSNLHKDSKIALLDVAGGNSNFYAGKFTFDAFALKPSANESDVLDALKAAETHGYTVLIIDGLSKASAQLIEAISSFAGHVIATFQDAGLTPIKQFDFWGQLDNAYRINFSHAVSLELQGASFVRPGAMVAHLLADCLEIV